MRYSERKKALKNLNDYSQEYLGLAELASVLDLTKQAVSNRIHRGRLSIFCVRLAMGYIWKRSDLIRWLDDDNNHLND